MAVILVLALAAALNGADVRFHHLHYRVGDPAAAMTAAAARLGGVSTVVSGLGVGVRTGDTYLLFDRFNDDDPSGAEAVIDHVAFAAGDFEKAVNRLAQVHTVVARREDAVMFAAGGLRLEIVRESEAADLFWCPMHPDARRSAAGTCPICAMALVPIPPQRIGEYKLDVVAQRARRTGLTGLHLTVRDPQTNAKVTDFVTIHEKTLHLFIVSRDLSYFAHVHPDPLRDGTFLLRHALPPGEYMLLADFLPNGGSSQMVPRALISPGPRRSSAPPRVATTGGDLTATVGGVRFSLEPKQVEPGREACLTITMSDEQTGAPVTDLQPFLGAPAHMLVVRADLSDAIHGHPEEIGTGGPTVTFHPLIPADGVYKVWIQIQRGGKVITAPFLVSAGR
ncbi:MAG: heavy metal-binding domain-containing protein [Vicinamibacterales bacterium]